MFVLFHRSSRERAAVLVNEFDRLPAADELGETFVRRRDGETVGQARPGVADHVLLRLTRSGSAIVVDNAVRGHDVADPANPDPDVQGVRKFFERVAAEPRVSATALQTVGVKGWDGLAIVPVN